MTENDGQESRFGEPLAVLVAGGSSVRDAAAEVGCSESTAYRASSSDPFRRRVAELRSEITSQSVGLLAEGATRAARTLVALLDDDEASTRLAAAKAILGALPRVSEFGELRERVDAIERLR